MNGNWGSPTAVFGEQAKMHPVTKRYIETGSGALPERAQVARQLVEIEQEQGKAVADRMRREIAFLEEPTDQQEPSS
jgi:hypothetical protein